MSTLKSPILPLAFLVFSVVHISALDAAASGIHPCNSTASSPSGVAFACPHGDGDPLGPNLTILVTVRDNVNAPVPGVPASDIWVIGCNDLLTLCDGSAAISASGPTDINGQTTITGDLAAGGCDLGGARVVVQGYVLGAGICGSQPCLPIQFKSADLNGNLVVDVADFSAFAAGYPANPAPNDCRDFNGDRQVGIVDYAKYAVHVEHACAG